MSIDRFFNPHRTLPEVTEIKSSAVSC